MGLECRNISKSYNGKTYALENVSFSFGKGLYALLGENGAGKSTWMNILTGLLRPSAGEVLYCGKNIQKDKKSYYQQLGYLPQHSDFYPYFTGKEFLEYMGVLKGIPKQERRREIVRLMEIVNLSEVADKKCGNYSGGMRKRLGIAQAMMGSPEVIILDEPTAGLDPQERTRFREIMSAYAASGHTVIISTHILSDVESVADHCIFVHQGHMIKEGPSDVLLAELEGKLWGVPDLADIQESLGFYKKGSQLWYRVLRDEAPAGGEKLLPGLEDVYHNCCTSRNDQ